MKDNEKVIAYGEINGVEIPIIVTVPTREDKLLDTLHRDRPSLKEQDEAERRAFKEMYGRSHGGMAAAFADSVKDNGNVD